jgi:hypothetical protein
VPKHPRQGRRARRGDGASKTARQFLLAATDGIYTSQGEKVDHREVAGDMPTPSRQRRAPPRLGRQIGILIELQQPEDDFPDAAAADRPETPAPLPRPALL